MSGWLDFPPFAESDTSIDDLPGFPDLAELRESQSEDGMGAKLRDHGRQIQRRADVAIGIIVSDALSAVGEGPLYVA